MISPLSFYRSLLDNGIKHFVGVPDSLLKDFCAFLFDNVDKNNHIITANEGNGIGMATGYYLATGELACVYMQNSGIGNAMNPLLSLADKEVYGIPLLLLIGWRGEPGIKDEPQHIKQGKIQESLLNVIDMPYAVIDKTTENVDEIVQHLTSVAVTDSCPVALVVKKGTFFEYVQTNKITDCPTDMLREEALAVILNETQNGVIVSTTGKTSREIFEARAMNKLPQTDFLTVGSMGHSSSIALSISLAKPEKKVFCLDGDGALLMHLGATAIIGSQKPSNFYHILLNNSCHESVGGQPTASNTIDFENLSQAVGYRGYFRADNEISLKTALRQANQMEGPILIEVIIRAGSRSNLGRPTTTPQQNKQTFMDYLKD